MAKFGGSSRATTAGARKGESEMDWSLYDGTDKGTEAVEAGVDQVFLYSQQAPPVPEVDTDQQEALGVDPSAGLDVFSDIRGQSVSNTRQDIADDPELYDEFQGYEGGNIGQPGAQVGVGVGYDPINNAKNPSPANAIRSLQQRLENDPNDFMAREQLLKILPNDHMDTETGKTFGISPALPGEARPGSFEFGKMTVEDRLSKVNNSAAQTRKVESVLNEMTFNLNEEEKVALSSKINAKKEDGTDFEPESMNELVNGALSTYANVVESGGQAPLAFADIAKHVVFKNTLDSLQRQAKAEDKKDYDGFLDAEEQADQDVQQGGSDAAVGRQFGQAMGLKGNPTLDTATGALMKEIVGRSFPDLYTKKNGKWEFNDEHVGVLQEERYMGSVILPESNIEVRKVPMNEQEMEAVKRRIKKNAHKRANKERAADGEYGDQEFNADVALVLGNIGYTLDEEFFSVVEALVKVQGDGDNTNYIDKLIGITGQGALNDRPSQRAVMKDGKPVPDANDPTGYKTEFYLGDTMKDLTFNKTLDWVKGIGKSSIYYDYAHVKNQRFMVQQNEGNYQSDKLTRAGLQAQSTEVYDIKEGSQDLKDLKAGIMKKFGHDTLGVNAAGKEFDLAIDKWMQLTDDFAGADPDKANAAGRKIIDIAEGKEGWASISAMKEAVRLQKTLNAVRANPNVKPQYRSKFFTEIDGVANGLGHNSMQSGDIEVARRTNLNPDVGTVVPGTARTDEYGRPLVGDVYTLAGSGAEAAIKAGSNQTVKNVWEALFPKKDSGNGERSGLRNFSKKPLMIFGYGAGWNKINGTVDTALVKYMDKHPDIREAVNTVVSESDMKMKDVFEKIHDAYKTGIEAEFKGISELAHLLTELATEAVAQGKDVSAITVGGHKILFGLDWTDLNTDKSFFDSDKGISVKVRDNVLKPQGRVVKGKGKTYDRLAREGEIVMMTNRETGKEFPVPAGVLKAATQAAVLLTHNNDAANIGMSFMELSKDPKTNISAQVFDGVLTTPKQAGKVARQLNRDFVAINKTISNLKRLQASLKEQQFSWAGKKAGKLYNNIRALEHKREKLIAKITAEKTKQFFWD